MTELLARGVAIAPGAVWVRRRNGSGDAHRVVWEFFHPAWKRTSWGTACGRRNLGDSKNLAANTTGKARPCPNCW